MTDRVVVLRSSDAASFLADACAALAEAANEVHLVGSGQQVLVHVYAETVAAFARLLLPQFVAEGQGVRVRVIEHLLDRLAQARSDELAMSVLDVADRLHGEVTKEPALA